MAQRHAPTVSPGPISLQRHGREPVHAQIEQALRAHILHGRWPAGSKLPPEPDLATQLGVNRGTLRRALQSLTHAGLLTARRGRGTFVTDIQAPSIAQRFRSLSEDLAAQGITFSTRVLTQRMIPADEECRLLFGLPAGAAVFALRRVFVGADGPLAYIMNLIRADRCPGLDEVDFTRHSLFGTLADRYGIEIARGRRTFRARAAAGEVATALAVHTGHPVLFLEQMSYTVDGEAIERSDVSLRSDRVAISSILERDAPPRSPAIRGESDGNDRSRRRHRPDRQFGGAKPP